ncbi:MAG TPA: hypothetical protein VGB49_05915, partial [Caulobacteraceae bacterium]
MTDSAPAPDPDWAAAREDYLAGIPAPMVAERHGLSQRTIRRRAAREGWRREDMPAGLPPWRAEGQLAGQVAELDAVVEARELDEVALLFDPRVPELRQYAFRRAATAAATDAPQTAVIWMRLVHLLDRTGDRLEREAEPNRDVDNLRAAYLRALRL